MKSQNFILSISLFLLLATFVFFLFKNIQYPLMWGDEADTALFAERIIKYGYPKIHQDNNSLVLFSKSGLAAKLDVVSHPAWTQYYYAVPGAFFAQKIDDIYLKTAILRVPFALAGLVGILILFLSLWKLFNRQKIRLFYLNLYLALQIISISLILHFREVRAYSLVVLLLSLLIVLFCDYYFFTRLEGRKTFWKKLVPIFVLQQLLFLSLPQTMYIFVGSLIVFVFVDFGLTKFLRQQSLQLETDLGLKRKSIVFLAVISLISVIPLLIFFGLLQNLGNYYTDLTYNWSTYWTYIIRIISYLNTYHFLPVYVFSSLAVMVLSKNYLMKNKPPNSEDFYLGIRIALYFLCLLVIYILGISRTPWLFDRYYIFLQPLLSVMILLNFYLIFTNLSTKKTEVSYLLYFLVLAFLLTGINKVPLIKDYWFQLNNRYVGPIDVIINYLKSTYQDPSKLIIYTNIEQLPFEYYLKSKTSCDNNDYCFDRPPDIIIPRMYMLKPKDFEKFLTTHSYQKIFFNIVDYPVNNIPELTLNLRHLFKTPLTTDVNSRLNLYILQQ